MAAAPQVVIFSDLVGFTAMAEAHGDEVATRLLDDVTATLDEVARAFGLRKLKSMGDGFLLTGSDPQAALSFGIAALRELGELDGVLGLRIGMHRGPVVERDGDVLGRTVNLAARIMSLATAGELLATPAVLDGTEIPEGVARSDLGRVRLRSLPAPVEVCKLTPVQVAGRVTDPVCQMRLDPATAASFAVGHRTYYFCSPVCLSRFKRHPEDFVKLSLKSKLCLATRARRKRHTKLGVQWS